MRGAYRREVMSHFRHKGIVGEEGFLWGMRDQLYLIHDRAEIYHGRGRVEGGGY